MTKLSQYFLPTLREDPKEAEIISHRYMLRAGMIKQTSAGIYAWLPLGYKVLRKIEQIIREEQDKAGAQEVLMPTLQSADLWRESGRYDAYGAEMLRIKDRGDRDMLYGPTNEEMVTDIFRSHIKSYRDLPKNFYHIQWKFRDEIRPRFGVMRGREFLMKDAYSFDLTPEEAKISYMKMFLAYLRTFRRLGVKAIPMRADTGPIGGDLSHEFIILAETGESEVYTHKKWREVDVVAKELSYDDTEALKLYFEEMTSIYAATEDIHDPDNAPSAAELNIARGIEVGHIFYFGTKYSKPMGATVQNQEGQMVNVEMGSYGIGVSRVVAAIIESSHDEKGIIWPEEVAPFDVGLINLRQGDVACDRACEDVYKQLRVAGKDVLYDDRDIRAGEKFADMDLIGVPWQVLVGLKGLNEGAVELKNRKTGETKKLALGQIVSMLSSSLYK